MARAALPILLALLLGPAVAAANIAGTAPAELRREARSVLADDRFQRDLPASPSPAASPSRGIGGFGGGASAPPALSGLSTVVRVVLWGLLGLAVVLAALPLVQSVLAYRRPERPAAPESAPAALRPSSDEPPGDHAALAGEGRYAEAVHALLLTAIALLARRFRLPLPPSRTSRELLRAVPLEGAAREAFAGLVLTVERSWFGGAALGPEDYRQSLERFNAFAGRAA